MTSGMLELGGFSTWDVWPDQYFAGILDQQVRAIRLDSTWARDQPKQLHKTAIWRCDQRRKYLGGAVRLGGLQWATNFSIQPDFIPFPLPEMSGEVAMPSTVDLYVNNTIAHESRSAQRAVQHPRSTGNDWSRGCKFGGA